MHLDLLGVPGGAINPGATQHPVGEGARGTKASAFDELLAYLLGGTPLAAPAGAAAWDNPEPPQAVASQDGRAPAAPTWPAETAQPVVVGQVASMAAWGPNEGQMAAAPVAAAELAGWIAPGQKPLANGAENPAPALPPPAEEAPLLPTDRKQTAWSPGGRPLVPPLALAATALPESGSAPEARPAAAEDGTRSAAQTSPAVLPTSPAASSGVPAVEPPGGRPMPATPGTPSPAAVAPDTEIPLPPSPPDRGDGRRAAEPAAGRAAPAAAANAHQVLSPAAAAYAHHDPSPAATVAVAAVAGGSAATAAPPAPANQPFPAAVSNAAATPGTAQPSAGPVGGVAKNVTPAAQVARQIVLPAPGARGEQRVTLQLEPEHLGRVEVRIVASGDRLDVVLQAENGAAAQALRDNLQELVRALGGRGEGRWQHVEIRIAEPAGNGRVQVDQEHGDAERNGGRDGRQQRDGRRQDPHGGR